MTMLDRMRRHKGWLKWSLGLVVLAFIAFYATDFADPTATSTVPGTALPSEVVAEINGTELTAGEFQRRYLTQMQAYQTAYGGSVSEQLLRQLGFEQQILQQMIDEQAALAEAERQGIQVTDEELAQQIFSIPGLQENGQFIGEVRYEQLLRSQRPPMTKGDFEANLRRGMMIDKLRAALTDWMAVSEQELEREFKRRNERVKLQVVALTADRFRDQVTVTDQDIAAYFEQHKAEYRFGEQRKIRMLLVDRDAARAKVTISEPEIQRYYTQNLQQYTQPEQVRASHILLNTAGKTEADVQKQAQELLKRAQSGEDFAALAKQYSEDEGSKVNGGDLNYFPRGQMVPEFEQAAFNAQPGTIVPELVKSQFGFHIIKVVDKRAGATTALDAVRAQIQDTLAWQRVDTQITAQAQRLADQSNTPAELESAAKAAGITPIESEYFQRGDAVPGLGVAPAVSGAAFTLADAAVSEPLTSPRGPVIITVTGKKDPYVPALDEVKERVRTDVIRDRAAALSRERAAAIAATLRGASDFVAAAKGLGLEAKETDLIARESPLPDLGVSPEVDQVAFSLPAGNVSDPISTADGTAIIRVVERDDVTADEFSTARETFRAEFLNERRSRFFTAYLNRAKEKMAIQINQDVVRRAVGVPTS